jgi:large subunit ribosomal protein L15
VKLHELKPAPGSHHPRKRVGRGPGSGHGKTSTRGQKGQRARTSVNLPKAFEGGQTRLTMRTPKLRGFHNRWKKRFAVLNLTRLNRFEDGAEIRPEHLLETGIIKDVRDGIKVLGTGDLKRKLVIHAHRFSAEARRKIEAAGGTAAVIEVPAPIRPKTKRAKNQPKPAVAAPVEKESEAEDDAAPAKGSKKQKAEKGGKPEKAEKAAKPEQGARAEKAERGNKGDRRERGEKGQATRASDSEDSPKPDKGKKKS